VIRSRIFMEGKCEKLFKEDEKRKRQKRMDGMREGRRSVRWRDAPSQ
jgi:hypothetical protein